jgi:hypothetical protein
VKHDLKGSVKVYRVESCTLHVPHPADVTEIPLLQNEQFHILIPQELR